MGGWKGKRERAAGAIVRPAEEGELWSYEE